MMQSYFVFIKIHYLNLCGSLCRLYKGKELDVGLQRLCTCAVRTAFTRAALEGGLAPGLCRRSFVPECGAAGGGQDVPAGFSGVHTCPSFPFFLCFFFLIFFSFRHISVSLGIRYKIDNRKSFLLCILNTKNPLLTSIAFFVCFSLFLHKHSYLDRETSLLLRNIAGKPSHLLTKVILLSTCMQIFIALQVEYNFWF